MATALPPSIPSSSFVFPRPQSPNKHQATTSSPTSPTKPNREALKPNAHPYAIKTTSTALLSRSSSSPNHSHSSVHHYVPASPSPSPTRSGFAHGSESPVKGSGGRHRYSRSLTNDPKLGPRPLPVPPGFYDDNEDTPTRRAKLRANRRSSTNTGEHEHEHEDGNVSSSSSNASNRGDVIRPSTRGRHHSTSSTSSASSASSQGGGGKVRGMVENFERSRASVSMDDDNEGQRGHSRSSSSSPTKGFFSHSSRSASPTKGMFPSYTGSGSGSNNHPHAGIFPSYTGTSVNSEDLQTGDVKKIKVPRLLPFPPPISPAVTVGVFSPQPTGAGAFTPQATGDLIFTPQPTGMDMFTPQPTSTYTNMNDNANAYGNFDHFTDTTTRPLPLPPHALQSLFYPPPITNGEYDTEDGGYATARDMSESQSGYDTAFESNNDDGLGSPEVHPVFPDGHRKVRGATWEEEEVEMDMETLLRMNPDVTPPNAVGAEAWELELGETVKRIEAGSNGVVIGRSRKGMKSLGLGGGKGEGRVKGDIRGMFDDVDDSDTLGPAPECDDCEHHEVAPPPSYEDEPAPEQPEEAESDHEDERERKLRRDMYRQQRLALEAQLEEIAASQKAAREEQLVKERERVLEDEALFAQEVEEGLVKREEEEAAALALQVEAEAAIRAQAESDEAASREREWDAERIRLWGAEEQEKQDDETLETLEREVGAMKVLVGDVRRRVKEVERRVDDLERVVNVRDESEKGKGKEYPPWSLPLDPRELVRRVLGAVVIPILGSRTPTAITSFVSSPSSSSTTTPPVAPPTTTSATQPQPRRRTPTGNSWLSANHNFIRQLFAHPLRTIGGQGGYMVLVGVGVCVVVLRVLLRRVFMVGMPRKVGRG